ARGAVCGVHAPQPHVRAQRFLRFSTLQSHQQVAAGAGCRTGGVATAVTESSPASTSGGAQNLLAPPRFPLMFSLLYAEGSGSAIVLDGATGPPVFRET